MSVPQHRAGAQAVCRSHDQGASPVCTGHMSTTLNPKSNMVLDSSCALWQIDNEPDLAVRAGTCGQDQNDWWGLVRIITI